MPIRINLLAEQQAAEEARRKDPVKRAIWIGSILVFATLVWTLTLQAQVKAKREEMKNVAEEFAKVDESAKAIRNMQAELGQTERRIASLERYSTNRILWGSMLDGLQKATIEQIRLKSVAATQRYLTNAATNFYSTNVLVNFDAPAPFWKFWASSAASTPVYSVVSNMFKTITNSGPFLTNQLPYTVKMDVVATNLDASTVTVKVDFGLPAVAIEDIDVTLAAGDYGTPPGGMIDTYARNLVAVPYFATHLSKGENRLRFTERPPNPQPDMTDPASPMFLPFTVKLEYDTRTITNE